MKKLLAAVCGGILLLATDASPVAAAETGASSADGNVIEAINVDQQGAQLIVKVALKSAVSSLPTGFSTATPARVALDFMGASNGLGRNTQSVNTGALRNLGLVQVGDRTRLVLNLDKRMEYEVRGEDRFVYVTLTPLPGSVTVPQRLSQFASFQPAQVQSALRDVSFRRGKDGEARIVVELSDANAGVDIRQQGQSLTVDFSKVFVPDELRKKLDVADFGTPVMHLVTQQNGENGRIVITPKGLWEHVAYQTESQFVVEVRPVVEDPNKLIQGSRGGYKGERLSLNFQNVDVRRLLQVIGEFTGMNVVVSDTVSGAITLILKDVPWDQALDIILRQKGLDMRKSGNVISIAPRDELATREKLELESKLQIGDIEPIRTEDFQMNYQKAEELQKLLTTKDAQGNSMLSKRGSAAVDKRTNKLFVQDTPSRLEDVRRLIAKIDVPVRQVLIEARIVEAADTFSRNLGVRLGLMDLAGATAGHGIGGARYTVGGQMSANAYLTGQQATQPAFSESLGVNLPANKIGTATPSAFSFTLFNNSKTQFLNLELSALEADGRGKVVSSPRVVTADQSEALIEQGVELPYESASSSGATTVAFKKANLSLKVTPQITPDGKVMMKLDINKDAPNPKYQLRTGIAIDTKHVKTEVLVENGGTVVIGGIYTQDKRENTNRTPLLGDIPYLGWLFKQKDTTDDRTELLVFITPKIISESLGGR
ncbi:MAG: type IV pilus secretin PilQ family protein [Betaproteobacteria bacterium]|nr:type IV pilus secretin PilQ family protein [Betaproteobacteria bacterium]